MISCDTCGEWYHGSCIGVTRKMAQNLDKRKQPWECFKCIGRRLVIQQRKWPNAQHEKEKDKINPHSESNNKNNGADHKQQTGKVSPIMK